MKRQVSFLGKAQSGYRNARYRLDDGKVVEGPFFGLSLAREERPGELWLLGTPSSMWDVLLVDYGNAVTDDALQGALIDAASAGTVTDELLAPFERGLSEATGIECRLRITGYARDSRGQAGLLAAMAEGLNPGDTITLDVTHGFRHLPMLALAAAHYLEQVKRVQVADILYAAFDMAQGGEVPVVRLDGLLRVLDWVQALAGYDASGDYAAFGPLLEAAGVKGAGKRLAEAGFEERITRHVRARECLQGLDLGKAVDDPMAALFAPELRERTRWWRSDWRWEREAALARRYWERGDFLRAAIYAQEALISRHMGKVDTQEYLPRESTRKTLEGSLPGADTLFHLRNELAHGVTSKKRDANVVAMLQSAPALRAGLRGLMDKLLG